MFEARLAPDLRIAVAWTGVSASRTCSCVPGIPIGGGADSSKARARSRSWRQSQQNLVNLPISSSRLVYHKW